MTPYQHSRTPLMQQQVAALEKAAGRRAFAYLMEQGTGKSLVIIEEALRLYAAGAIDAVAVIAPNGVQENWILGELPKHVPETIPTRAAYWSATPNRREKAALERLMTPRAVGAPPPLRWLGVNYEALLTDKCFRFVESFLRSGKAMIVADESQKIKGHNSRRTRRALNLRKGAAYRRIATGTPIANGPLDAFSQFAFLEEGLLGTDSLVAFRKEYCELLPDSHGIMRHIRTRRERALGRELKDWEWERMAPAMVAQDAHGQPIYKNLDRLAALIAPHAYRVLKEDCLDLPPKQYESRFFHLTKAQRANYDMMEREFRHVLQDGSLLITTRLVALQKLCQITSGFILMRNGDVSYIEDNPRIELLCSEVEDITEQGLIWSQYKEEQRNISRMLTELGHTHETINGDVSMKRRREIRDEFQAGNLQWINAHPETLGAGFTLTAGKINLYYSNGFNLTQRIQSEDRTHRIGTLGTIVYRDLIAIDTRDDDVVWALQRKLDVSAMINGDPERKSRFAERENE